MGKHEKKQYLAAILPRYLAANREDKRIILNEFCLNCNYNRKYAIRLINGQKTKPNIQKAGPKPVYDNEELMKVLKRIWFAADQPCGLRLKAILTEWLPHYEEHYHKLDPEIKNKLLKISKATIDRLLTPVRAASKGKGRCTTKPGTFLKSQIPILTNHWDVSKPGYMEADTVAHCGNSLSGHFIWSLTMTDIHTGWTENRAVWNKLSHAVQTSVSEVEANVPFKLLGFDSDNGSEFINLALYDFFRNREDPIQFTRSRPYKKNDNAHVEQKNWTHVRQLLGYDRLEDEKIMPILNDLYRNEWSQYQNHFNPSMKLKSKTRDGAKVKKKYEDPTTPYLRLMNSEHIDEETKERLKAKHLSLNPFKLKADIEHKLDMIFRLVKVTSNVRQRC